MLDKKQVNLHEDRGACSGAAAGRGPYRKEGPAKQKCSPGPLQGLWGWKVWFLGWHRLSPSPWKLGPNMLLHLSSLSPEQLYTGPSSATLKFLNVTAVFSCPPRPHVSTSNLSTFLARLGLCTRPFSQPLWAKNSASYLAVSLAQLPSTFIINLLTTLLDHLLPCHMDLVNVPTQSQLLAGQQMSLWVWLTFAGHFLIARHEPSSYKIFLFQLSQNYRRKETHFPVLLIKKYINWEIDKTQNPMENSKPETTLGASLCQREIKL